MEHDLCEAAIKGDIDSLDAIIGKDPLILHKVVAGCFSGTSPLHVATSNKQTRFVEKLLSLKPELAEVLDLQLRSALHLASAQGHAEIVKVLLEKGGLEMCLVRDRDGKNPLHIAAMASAQGHAEIVKVLLEKGGLEMCLVRDRDGKNPLHIAAMASAQGHVEILKVLLEKGGLEMCLVRDRDGKNPLHIAAMKGKISALEELVRKCPEAARVRVDQNETILHLCVKHNQLESLNKLLENIKGRDFVNAKDSDGNTILHLAILYEHFEIACYVLEKLIIDVNAINASGHTAMDILFLGPNIRRSDNKEESHIGLKKEEEKHIEDLLRKVNARQAEDLVGGDWLTNKRESLMVVASLIATMAFQAGVSPPGGVWQDDSKETNGYRAGEAVMAYNYQDSYPYFLRFNTIGFVASLSTILLLMSGLKFRNKATMWVLIVTMWLAITSMAITYSFSNFVVTPKKDRPSLTNVIKIGVIVWSSVMGLLLVKHTIVLVAFFAKERRSRWRAVNRIHPQSFLDNCPVLRKLLCIRDGGPTA